MGEKTPQTPPKWFFFCAADEGEGEEKSGDEADKGVSNFFFFFFFLSAFVANVGIFKHSRNFLCFFDRAEGRNI